MPLHHPGQGRTVVAPAVWAFAALLVLAGCSQGDAGKTGKKPPPPLVAAAQPVMHRFVDRIEAVGTARANEHVTMASSVTERIERIYFNDGAIARKGQLLASLSQAQERASLAGALAAEKEALAQLKRVKDLSSRGFATQAALDAQVAAAQTARANAAEAQAQISDREIRAPFSGYVSLRTISEGAIVTSGTPLVTVSDLSRIKLDFTVPETQLARLRVGQPIAAIAAAYPDQPFAGRISSIDPVIDLNSRAILVRATLPNPGARIKPGMLMTVHVETATRTSPAVPELAVMGDGASRYVYVVNGGKAKRVPVRTGMRDNGVIEIAGVPPGAVVIGEGVVKVTDGAKVRLAGDKDGEAKGKRVSEAMEGRSNPRKPSA